MLRPVTPHETAVPTTPGAAAGRLGALLTAALPPQGAWSDEAYLWLTDHSRHLIEFTDGWLEELPTPSSTHQAVLLFLYDAIRAYLRSHGGMVMVAPLRLRIREGKFREPDLMLLLQTDDPRYEERYWMGADLVTEVMSPDDPNRDLVQKRTDYAEAGVHEYWIADPRHETILVRGLDDGAYRERGMYGRGDKAASPSLDGLFVDVAATFDAAKRKC